MLGRKQRHNDHIRLVLICPRQRSIGRAQPSALFIKCLAGAEIGGLKSSCPPDGLVCEPAYWHQFSHMT